MDLLLFPFILIPPDVPIHFHKLYVDDFQTCWFYFIPCIPGPHINSTNANCTCIVVLSIVIGFRDDAMNERIKVPDFMELGI